MAIYDQQRETMSLDNLRQLQLDKFKRQVKRVYENKVFHQRFKEAGLEPGDIQNWDDLKKVPFTGKQDLREYYPTGLVSGNWDDVVRVHMTSGTTGVPVSMVYTRNDLAVWGECMARNFTAAGVTKKDVVQQAHGYGLFTGGLGFHYGLERVGAKVIPTGSGGSKRQLQLMREWGTTVFTGTPTYALYLGEIAREMGIDPVEDLQLRIGCHGGEPCSDEMRERINERLGYTAHGGGMRRCYGLTEMGGPMAMDCAYVSGIHVWGDHFLLEVLDPETLTDVSPGQPGEIVLSNLSFEAMPILRYRTGDRAVIDETPCPCGRTHPRIVRFLGRVDDMLLVSGTNVFPSQIECVLLQYRELSENWQIVVGERKGLHTLKVEVEPAGDFNPAESFVELLEKELHDFLEITCRVEIKSPGTLPRYEGKAVRVVDERKVSL
ncbi:phenylacetate--CoA ligase family protein [Desulfotomaculum copahuensis]|nr:phenylacetate--CoA ligase [Desulfotomaculum copahuensis]